MSEQSHPRYVRCSPVVRTNHIPSLLPLSLSISRFRRDKNSGALPIRDAAMTRTKSPGEGEGTTPLNAQAQIIEIAQGN